MCIICTFWSVSSCSVFCCLRIYLHLYDIDMPPSLTCVLCSGIKVWFRLNWFTRSLFWTKRWEGHSRVNLHEDGGIERCSALRLWWWGGGVGYQTPCWRWTFAFFTPQVFLFFFWAGSHPFCPPTSYATRRFPFCVLFMWQICVVFLLQLQFFTF